MVLLTNHLHAYYSISKICGLDNKTAETTTHYIQYTKQESKQETGLNPPEENTGNVRER